MLDSASFCEFGAKYLEKPGPRAGIEKRTFFDLKDEIIKERNENVMKFLKFKDYIILICR